MKAEYRKGCLQRDSVERKGYVERRVLQLGITKKETMQRMT